ncbi:hypothetical protein KKC59_01040 [bacterium]|nr:hypothetical protein [bacterium]
MKTMVRLFLAGIFFYIVGTNNQCLALSNSDQIHKLFLKNIELDKKIFEKLTFKLSDFQPLFSGQNVKFILQGSDGRLWFFKNGGSFLQTNNLYNWFLLCGENRPICYNIVLPINGETVKGIVQEFIPYSKNLDNISVAKLSKKQIEFIQRQQIINWFICSEEAFNCDPGQFLVQKNKIISVEKGNPFSTNHLSESLIDNFNDPLYARDNYYNVFWKAYINNEIEVDFKKSFELIDYIQNLDDRFIEEIFRFSMPAEVSVSLIIERKNRLRNEFEKYYHYLANQRGSILEAPVFQTNANFFERVFVKLKKDIRKKQVILKGLEKKNVPQANIDVVL